MTEDNPTTGNPTTGNPTPPTPEQVLQAMRTGLVRVLPAEDLAQVDLGAIDTATAMLSLPVDSAALMALMTELEDTFSVFIEEEAAFSFTTVGDIAGYIATRAAEKARRLGEG